MKTEVKTRLHWLVDKLPEEEVHAAERYLEYLAEQADPLVTALSNSSEVDEPLTDDDRAALEEGRLALDASDTVSDDELRSQLGI
jgi:3-hydroxyisobutyrate dehydrogenase-like beta-hydroxyacid dehydrogenase